MPVQAYVLLNCDDHASYLRKHKLDPALYRPDICHQVSVRARQEDQFSFVICRWLVPFCSEIRTDGLGLTNIRHVAHSGRQCHVHEHNAADRSALAHTYSDIGYQKAWTWAGERNYNGCTQSLSIIGMSSCSDAGLAYHILTPLPWLAPLPPRHCLASWTPP